MEDELKNDLFEFIKLKCSNLKEVVSYKIKDYDDEDGGAIGEHYIVDCILNATQYRHVTLSKTSTLEIKRTCLVDRDEFRRWRRKENSIKWIN